MPPKRCPECGRFLANDLVEALEHEPAPCPRCGIELRADSVVGGEAPRQRRSRPRPAPAAVVDPPAAAADMAEAHSLSVRPPDLDPTDVRSGAQDVLADWDVGVGPEEVAAWRADRRPFPADTVTVVLGATIGAMAAAGTARRHRVAWCALGALAGAGAVGASRRVWELRA